jgi:glycosyltransferase involved in cell wall biosynthesis
MKILQIAPVAPPHRSGMAVAAGEIARVTAAAGADVTFVSAIGGAPIPGVTIPNVQSYRIPGAGFLSFTPAIRKLIAGTDIVHLHYPCFGNAWMVERALGSKPLIITYHMDVIGRGVRVPIFRFHQKYLAPRFLRRAAQIVLASRDYAEHSLLAKHPELMTKVVEIPFGIDTKRFFPSKGGTSEVIEEHRAGILPSEARSDFPERRGFRKHDDGSSAILFVGGLDEQHYFKGLHIVLKALVSVPNTILTVVGNGNLRERYWQQARELGIVDRVTFAGNVSDDALPQYYRAADLCVLPSIDRSEAYGLVLTEAAASGIPAIATALPGVRTVIKDGETGLLVAPNDVGALADAIKRILSDVSLRTKMGAAARAFAESRTWKQCGEEYLKVYKSVIR